MGSADWGKVQISPIAGTLGLALTSSIRCSRLLARMLAGGAMMRPCLPQNATTRGSVACGRATSALLRPNRYGIADRGKALLLPSRLFLPVSI
jgi:hypothetical protein